MYFSSDNHSVGTNRKREMDSVTSDGTSSHVTMRAVSFLVALILVVAFVIDCGDWIVNQERNVSTVNGTTMVHEQSRIITILGFLRTQFSFLLGTTMAVILLWKAEDILTCFRSVTALKNIKLDTLGTRKRSRTESSSLVYLTDSERTLIPSTSRWSIEMSLGEIICWCVIILMAVLDILRAVILVHEGKGEKSLSTYFVFHLPREVLFPIVAGANMFAHLPPLCFYGIFCNICVKYIACVKTFNKLLTNSIKQIAQDQNIRFKAVLDALSGYSSQVSGVLKEIDHCFSAFLLAVILENVLLLSAIVAQIFIPSLVPKKNALDYARTVAVFLGPSIPLLLIIVVCTSLHETRAKSAELWQDLVVIRQRHRDQVI
ncbi:hypothetical protein RvY_05075 [Ramazzottius varieornatus]|uniref:Uncharacterized protein n=1 Tax=Ramazzottius varieornatus TaxID=947166 RepID=A0A1D1V0I7_RAMVA|nr:hypothetical protein RvY_05075 [Ramazzottius varieornatus]